ncbi:MAG: tetratricopeptide repeat protein [Bacteroidota bacterium]
MSKLQLVVLSAAAVLLLLLMFGFGDKPAQQKAVDQSRALRAESTDITSLLKSAKADLSEEQLNQLLLIEQSLEQAPGDTARIRVLEQLSRQWFDLGHAEVAGFYAESLAEIASTEEAWSIAGTTYAIGLQRSESEKVRTYCNGRAIKAFESAISINPQEVAHQVNLALCYTEYPPKDNPMKGILMLLELNKKDPDNVSVLMNLGRLAIRTGQYDKAVQRLERVLELAPGQVRAHCYLADAYRGLGNAEKSSENQDKCQLALN